VSRGLEVTDDAQNDMLSIVEWLDERSISAGNNFLSDSRECFARLLRRPNAGRKFEPIIHTGRSFRYCRVSARFRSYFVFYEAHPRSIRIVAIVHGSRDLEVLLHARG
jgi:plasmid stabilization system protein ParE